MFWKWFLVTSAILLSIVSFAGEPQENEAVYVASIDEALRLAGVEGRMVYLMFKGKSCPWCDMQSDEMAKPESVSAMKGLVVFVADISDNRQLARNHGVRLVPSHRLLDSEGRVIKSSAGFMNAQEIRKFFEH